MKNYMSSLIIGFAIIIGFTIVGLCLIFSSTNESSNVGNENNEHRYELLPANENNIIIFDKVSGEYWTKFISNNEGPTNWEKGDSPIKNNDK